MRLSIIIERDNGAVDSSHCLCKIGTLFSHTCILIPQSQNAPYSYILHWKDKNCVLLNNIFICSSKESRNLKDKIFYIHVHVHVCWFFHLPWMSLILYPQIKWLWPQSLKRGDGAIAGLINVYFNEEYLKYIIMNNFKFFWKQGMSINENGIKTATKKQSWRAVCTMVEWPGNTVAPERKPSSTLPWRKHHRPVPDITQILQQTVATVTPQFAAMFSKFYKTVQSTQSQKNSVEQKQVQQRITKGKAVVLKWFHQ